MKILAEKTTLKTPTKEFFDQLQPCFSGKVLAEKAELKSHLIEIRQLISAPSDIYQELYLPTLHHFLEFCQALPEEMQEAVPYSLARRHLELAVTMLKLRRGQMLPENSNSETVAEQEALWTYALFTASLLFNMQRIQSDRTIELYKNENEKLGTWHPIVGNLYEPNTYYKIIAKPLSLPIDTVVLQTGLMGKMIPAMGMRWLSSYQDVFPIWLEAITLFPSKNILVQLLQKAAKAINFSVFDANPSSSSAVSSSEPLQTIESESLNHLQLLSVWIAEQLSEQSDTSNQPRKFLHLEQGLFISCLVLEEFLRLYPVFSSLEELLDQLKEYLSEVPKIEDDNITTEKHSQKQSPYIFQYRSIHFENRQILAGIIIAKNYLNDTLQVGAIQTDFIPSTSI